MFFKSGQRLLCACVRVREREREREKDVAGVLVELEASSARSTAHPLLSQTHKTLEKFFCHNKVQKLRRRRKDQQQRARRRARERASSTVIVDPRWRETPRREKTPGNSGSPGPPLHRVARPDRIRFFSESQR